MQWLKDFINSFFEILLSGFEWLIEGVGQVLSYVGYMIYDGVLTVIYSFVAAIDFSETAFNMAAQYAGLPSQLIWMINQVDLPQFFSYITIGISIRLVINLVPAAFTRI